MNHVSCLSASKFSSAIVTYIMDYAFINNLTVCHPLINALSILLICAKLRGQESIPADTGRGLQSITVLTYEVSNVTLNN